MVVAVFIVAHGGHVHDLRHHVGSDDRPFRAFFACLVSGERPCGGFKDCQCFSRVASGHAHDFVNGFVVDFDFVFKSMLAFDGPVDERFQVVGFQRFKFDDHGSAQQRFDDRETWIFRGGCNECDVTVFHAWQQCVLLRFGESVHLVDEQYCFLAFRDKTIMGASEYISHIFDAGGDCGKLFEDSTGLFGHNIGERGFADPGRPEQNNGTRCRQRAFGRRIGEPAQRRALP